MIKKYSSLKKGSSESISREDVAKILKAHKDRVDPEHGRDLEWFSDSWVDSDVFNLTTFPIDAVGASGKISGDSQTQGPIIVDLNKREVGRIENSFGAPPEILILDGKHRWNKAIQEGKKIITGFVGNKALGGIQRKVSEYNEKTNKIRKEIQEFLNTKNTSPGGNLRNLKNMVSVKELEEIRQAFKQKTNFDIEGRFPLI